MKAKPVIAEEVYNASAERVWKALTDKDEMKQWYFDLPGFKAEEGFEFSFYGEGKTGSKYLHVCKVTEAVPLKKLSYTWSYEGYAGVSTVTFGLFEEGDKTRVRLTHEGLENFPGDNNDFLRENFVEGWNYFIGKSLRAFVEAGK